MLRLKRENVRLDRDVIFLAEAGEEAPHASASCTWSTTTSRVDAEYCIAEAEACRAWRAVKYASVATTERSREPSSSPPAAGRHGSVRSRTTPHPLDAGRRRRATWVPPCRSMRPPLPTSEARLHLHAGGSEPIARCSADPKVSARPTPTSASRSRRTPRCPQFDLATMLQRLSRERDSSEVKATLDVRTLPIRTPPRSSNR